MGNWFEDKAKEATEEAKRKAAETKRKAEEEAAEAKRKAEAIAEEAKRKATEAKRKAEEEAAEAKRKAEAITEEAKRKAAEAKRKAEEEATEEAKRKAAEAKRKAEEAAAEAKRKAEEAAEEAKRKAIEAKRKAEEAAAEAKRKAEEAVEEAKRKAIEAKRKAEEAAAEAKRKADEILAETKRKIEEGKRIEEEIKKKWEQAKPSSKEILHLEGKIVYNLLSGPNLPVINAKVTVIELDQGGNGADKLFHGTTDEQGLFSKDVVWKDKNTFAGIEIPDILLMKITIEYDGTSETYPYLQDPVGPTKLPVVRMVPPDVIPQRDPLPLLRIPMLEINRKLYQWDQYEKLQAGCVKSLPPVEIPDADYFARRIEKRVTIQKNEAIVKESLPSKKFDDIDNYKLLYPAFKEKPNDKISILKDDRAFSLFRVAGPNPRVLHRVEKKLPAKCSFKDNVLAPFKTTIAEAIQKGSLFLCDYQLVDGVDVKHGRFFTAPYALFIAVSRHSKPAELVPVAIQIDRHDSNSVVTPASDNHKWQIAKLMVQVADLNHHEIKSHLWDCHLAMEPFAIAAARQLAYNHPIGRLLKIHFRYMIYQNNAARYDLTIPGPINKTLVNGLIAPNGFVDNLLGTGRSGALDIIVNARSNWSFGTAGIQADLNARGFNKKNKGIDIEYPFAEDGLAVNDVIARHVQRWVSIYYLNDSEVSNDRELQAFRLEVEDPEKGRLGNLPHLKSKADLESFLTQIIFTCTALHSAVNYSQYKYQAFIPNNPAGAWADWHDNPPLTDFLPNCSNSLDAVSLAAELSLYQYDKLGEYHETMRDNQSKIALQQFKDELRALAKHIDDNNTNRVKQNPNELRTMVEYPFLHPDWIANSISI